MYIGDPDDRIEGFESCPESRKEPFEKIYYIGRAMDREQNIRKYGCWLTGDAVERLEDNFNIFFDYNKTKSLWVYWTDDTPWKNEDFSYDKFFSHLIDVIPEDIPNFWLLGWEDMFYGGDTDHNDLVFIVNFSIGDPTMNLVSPGGVPVGLETGFESPTTSTETTVVTTTVTGEEEIPPETTATTIPAISQETMNQTTSTIDPREPILNWPLSPSTIPTVPPVYPASPF